MCASRASSKAFINCSKYSFPPFSRRYVVEKLACMPEPFQSVSPNGLQWYSISMPYFSVSRCIK